MKKDDIKKALAVFSSAVENGAAEINIMLVYQNSQSVRPNDTKMFCSAAIHHHFHYIHFVIRIEKYIKIFQHHSFWELR